LPVIEVDDLGVKTLELLRSGVEDLDVRNVQVYVWRRAKLGKDEMRSGVILKLYFPFFHD